MRALLDPFTYESRANLCSASMILAAGDRKYESPHKSGYANGGDYSRCIPDIGMPDPIDELPMILALHEASRKTATIRFLDGISWAAAGGADDVASASLDFERSNRSLVNLRFFYNENTDYNCQLLIEKILKLSTSIKDPGIRWTLVSEAVLQIRVLYISNLLKELENAWAEVKLKKSLSQNIRCLREAYKKYNPLAQFRKIPEIEALVQVQRFMEGVAALSVQLDGMRPSLSKQEQQLEVVKKTSELTYVCTAVCSIIEFGVAFKVDEFQLKVTMSSPIFETLFWPRVLRKRNEIITRASNLFGEQGKKITEDYLDSYGPSRFRLHAEMKTLVFYEEESQYVPLVYYIGCNLRPCFLCHHFIDFHGEWTMRKSSNIVFPFWYMPSSTEIVASTGHTKHARQNQFKAALRKLCETTDATLKRLEESTKARFIEHPPSPQADPAQVRNFSPGAAHHHDPVECAKSSAIARM